MFGTLTTAGVIADVVSAGADIGIAPLVLVGGLLALAFFVFRSTRRATA